MPFTLHKSERLNRKKIIDRMFQGGESRSFSTFPVRVVYLSVPEQDVPLSVMVSVSKRHFKRAVHRNRVKRLLREAWRLHKQPLADLLIAQGKHLAVALLYSSNELPTYAEIERRMKLIIHRLCEAQDIRNDETPA